MTVAYDGSRFHGFAANPGVDTVAGALAEAIAKVVGHDVALTCAGRTDAGVHAWGQVVHFDVATGPPLDLLALQRSLNKMLAPTVVVREAGVAPPGFDARRSATSRRYRYTVLNRPWPDPFLAATAWHVEEPLDLRSMQLACDPLIGSHDWSAFCHQMVRSLVGTLVAVGPGQKRAGDLAWIIRSRDRSLAGQPAPPHGLCLWEVRYG